MKFHGDPGVSPLGGVSSGFPSLRGLPPGQQPNQAPGKYSEDAPGDISGDRKAEVIPKWSARQSVFDQKFSIDKQGDHSAGLQQPVRIPPLCCRGQDKQERQQKGSWFTRKQGKEDGPAYVSGMEQQSVTIGPFAMVPEG